MECRHGELPSACEDCETERIESDNEKLRELLQQMTKQRDAWKEVAEHHYGLLRVAMYGEEPGYPVTGALDAWAAGRHLVLRHNARVSG